MVVPVVSLALPALLDERDWEQFHTLKDLAAAIAIEAAELQELLLWQKADEEDDVLERRRPQIEAELADRGSRHTGAIAS